MRALLRDQDPVLADLELRDVNGGWDNQQWRLGDELAVRLPRTERAPALLRTEQRWLPLLAKRLPLPTPTPVRVGQPSHLFEHTWTIASWVEGEPADQIPITRIDAAQVLVEFLSALHQQAPAEAPANPARGIPLDRLKENVDDWFQVIAENVDADAAREVWGKAVAAPAWQGAALSLHGDLHPANVVVRDGRLAAVIDSAKCVRAIPRPTFRPPGSCCPLERQTVLRCLWGRRRSHHRTSSRVGCLARPGLDRDRTERAARPARR